MDPRHVAFIAWEALRSFRRCVAPKEAPPLPPWYEVEDPDVQAQFQGAVDRRLQGDEAAFTDEGCTPAEDALLSAVCEALRQV
jgi:hypothetical protein